MQSYKANSLSNNINNNISNKDKWVFTLLLAIIFWMPVPLGSNRPWAWGILEILCYAVCTASVFYHYTGIKANARRFWPAFVCFGVFLLWVVIQQLPLPEALVKALSPNAHTLFTLPATIPYSQNSMPNGILNNTSTAYFISVDPGQTTIALYKTLAYISLFIATLLLCNTQQRIKTIMLTIIITGLFQAMYGTLEVLLGATNSLVFHLPVKNVATGTFVYKNHYANYLMLCLSMGVGYLVSTLINTAPATKKARLRQFLNSLLNGKAAVRIALAIMVIALVMSRSRMGNTAFFAAMTAIGLLALFLIKKRSKGLTLLIVSMFLIDMLILSAWFGLDKVKDRLENTSLTEETRDEVVRDSIPLLKDFALTGTGMGSFYTIYPKYQSSEVNAFYDHAHNDYLQFAIEAGIPVSALLLIVPLYSFYCAIKAMRKRKNPIMLGLSFGCLMAILGMFIHIWVDFPLQAPANTGLFVIILALSLISLKRTKKGYLVV